jgi:Ca-activated chloride channel family protein
MAAWLRGFVATVTFWMLAPAAQAADKAIIVLDASGSMWGQIDGKPKLDIARQALRTVLRSVPADLELGLLAYGHHEKGNCADIEIVVPPAAGTATAITSAADNLKFLGKTPLTASVRQAAEALRYTEDKATVILITDGLETCNADPCAVGRELEQSGVDFTAHVVGFGLTAEEGREIACLAENTGGKYIQASDAKALEEALVATVEEPAPVPEPEPEPEPVPEPAMPMHNFVPQLVLAEGGKPLEDAGNSYEIHRADASGGKGERVATEYDNYKGDLEPGEYVVVARLGEAFVEQPVRIEDGKVAEPIFVLNAGTLVVRPLPSPGATASDAAQVIVDHPGEGEAINYGETRIVVPAGEQKVTVKLGEGEATETLTVKAGEIAEKDIVVGVGRVVVNAFYAPDMKVEESGLDLKIYKAAKKIDGRRDQVSYAFGPDGKFDLPPGDYTVVATMDQAVAEQDFTVKTGERTEVSVTLNAGVLAVSAPGATHIEVFAAKKDIQGNRKAFGYPFAETHQTTLPVGDYVIVVDREDAGGKKEASATVKAGERAEVAVP